MFILHIKHRFGSVSEEEEDFDPAVAALSESALFIDRSSRSSAAQAAASGVAVVASGACPVVPADAFAGGPSC